MFYYRGAQVAQLVRHPTLDLSSGHDLEHESPTWGSVLTAWSLLGILSLPFSLPLPCSLSVSLKINKLFAKKFFFTIMYTQKSMQSVKFDERSQSEDTHGTTT